MKFINGQTTNYSQEDKAAIKEGRARLKQAALRVSLEKLNWMACQERVRIEVIRMELSGRA